MKDTPANIGPRATPSSHGLGPVSPVSPTAVNPPPHWSSILQNLNPLGVAARAFAQTLAYRLETQRLQAEMERIQAESQIAHKVIDGQVQLELKRLEACRATQQEAFQLAARELEATRIDRTKVLAMAEQFQLQTLDRTISAADRTMARDMFMAAMQTLPTFGAHGQKTLATLVQALPPLDGVAQLRSG